MSISLFVCLTLFFPYWLHHNCRLQVRLSKLSEFLSEIQLQLRTINSFIILYETNFINRLVKRW